MMVVMHHSDFKNNEESLRCSPENQVTTLNIDDYSVIITDNELPNIYDLIDKEKDHKGIQEQWCKPLFTVQDGGRHHNIKDKLHLSRWGL